MKICLVGPGLMEIPPNGWGAVEIIIWNQKKALEKAGNEVFIINTKSNRKIIKTINNLKPDIVHIHYDNLISIYKKIKFPKVITSHFGYLTQPKKYNSYIKIINRFKKVKPYIFALSKEIKDIYVDYFSFNESRIFLTPNGIEANEFRFTNSPKFPEKSLYLGKIEKRKRQYIYQYIDGISFVGKIVDSDFRSRDNYLGEWSKQDVHQKMTEYANLILLSDGEAHPLVCLEALSAGLGLVLSRHASSNLDLAKKFIDVVPDEKLSDINYIKGVIEENRKKSISSRDEIVKYASSFLWDEVVKKYYLPSYKKIISQYKNKV